MNTSATPRYTALRASGLRLALLFSLPFFLVACEIVEVEQPSEAVQGEVIEVNMTLGLHSEDENPHHGIISVLVPEDWSFVSGSYTGPLGTGAMEESDAWADSTDIVLPAPENMKWIGTISDQARAVPSAPTYMDVSLQLQVGQETGTFNLGYFFTSSAFATADMTFSESGKYDDNTADSLMNQPITVNLATSTDDGPEPREFTLSANFPNPFTSSTMVQFVLDRPAPVRVAVYDLAGREIAVLAAGHHEAGPHTAVLDGSQLASGLYLCRLEVDGQVVQTRIMTRLR